MDIKFSVGVQEEAQLRIHLENEKEAIEQMLVKLDSGELLAKIAYDEAYGQSGLFATYCSSCGRYNLDYKATEIPFAKDCKCSECRRTQEELANIAALARKQELTQLATLAQKYPQLGSSIKFKPLPSMIGSLSSDIVPIVPLYDHVKVMLDHYGYLHGAITVVVNDNVDWPFKILVDGMRVAELSGALKDE
jgi:hypothetical protein